MKHYYRPCIVRGTEWNIVHRSDKIKNTLNPKWEEEAIDLSVLCGGNLERPLRLSVYDFESSGDHIIMGAIETTVSELLKAKSSAGLKLRQGGEETGTLAVLVASVSGTESLEGQMAALKVSSPEPSAPPAEETPPPAPSAPELAPIPFTPPPPLPPTFLDYINGGCEMQLCVAIDFTGSNGDPRKPGTLHYLSPDGSTMNDYEKAICSIGGILADYDTDKKFPVWGKYTFHVYQPLCECY